MVLVLLKHLLQDTRDRGVMAVKWLKGSDPEENACPQVQMDSAVSQPAHASGLLWKSHVLPKTREAWGKGEPAVFVWVSVEPPMLAAVLAMDLHHMSDFNPAWPWRGGAHSNAAPSQGSVPVAAAVGRNGFGFGGSPLVLLSSS